MSELKFEVRTSVSKLGDIEQVVDQKFNGVVEEMYRNLVRLQDQGVRDALEELGWTPPKESESQQRALTLAREVCNRIDSEQFQRLNGSVQDSLENLLAALAELGVGDNGLLSGGTTPPEKGADSKPSA